MATVIRSWRGHERRRRSSPPLGGTSVVAHGQPIKFSKRQHETRPLLSANVFSLHAFHLPDVQRYRRVKKPRAAYGRRRISVPVSTPAHARARIGRTHDLRRTACRRPAPAADRYCATSFSQEASISPKSRPSLYIFPIWHVG